MKLLLDSGADATIRDKTGVTPLRLAIERRNKEAIAALLARGVKE